MANTKSRSLGPGLSNAEIVAGFCYLPFYVCLLSWLLQYGSDRLGLHWNQMQMNTAYFLINGIVIWVIFHNFLIRSFRSIRFWELVQAVILGFVLYYVGNYLFGLIITFGKIDFVSPNDEVVQQLMVDNRIAMFVFSVILAPIVEEALVRGLLFGVIRRKSRIFAYAVSILFFASIHVWQFVPEYGWNAVLIAGIQYIPPAIALGWTYEKSNTIWAPILLHAIINAMNFL